MELPTESRLRWLLRASSRLLEGGAEPVRGLILPTADFFPDRFDGRPAAVEALLRRVQRHAGLSDVPLALEIDGISAQSGSCSTGSCSTGSCSTPIPTQGNVARVRRNPTDEDGYVVSVAAAEVGHPVVLTTVLVRAIGHVFIREARLVSEFGRSEREHAVDVASAMLGFGVLLANGSYIYSKGCGGVRVSSATALPVQETAAALALTCHLHKLQPASGRAQLDPTPRAHFDAAWQWVRSNAGVVSLARTDRAAIEADSYSLNESRGWLSRLLGIGRSRAPSVPTDDELEKVAAELAAKKSSGDKEDAKQRRMQELRQLVDEALDT